eukprot:1440922-Pleurochrysis_carterae.AAC.2
MPLVVARRYSVYRQNHLVHTLLVAARAGTDLGYSLSLMALLSTPERWLKPLSRACNSLEKSILVTSIAFYSSTVVEAAFKGL